MDVLAFRSLLATALATYLGSYQLPNGSVTPALAVRGSGDLLTPGTKVSGLEVVIDAEPRDQRRIPSYNNEKSISTWRVVMTDWANSGQLKTIGTQLAATFPGTTISTPRKDAPGIGFRSQLELEIPDLTPTGTVQALQLPDLSTYTLTGPVATYDSTGRLTRIDYDGGFAKTFSYTEGLLTILDFLRPSKPILRKTLTWANGQWQRTSAPELI